jgi:hypothetical protein
MLGNECNSFARDRRVGQIEGERVGGWEGEKVKRSKVKG